MRQVKKKEGTRVHAYCLGENHEIIDKFMEDGYVKRIDEKHWKIFSQEASEGEEAVSGDYIKVDSSGVPYPNTRAYFLKHHRPLGGDVYEQIPRQLSAWCQEDDMCPEIQFLIEHKGLVIDEDNEKVYYRAPLWGDTLSAAKDAVIVFYVLEYDSRRRVVDAEFNFVARSEFDKTYDVLGESGEA